MKRQWIWRLEKRFLTMLMQVMTMKWMLEANQKIVHRRWKLRLF